MERYLDESMLFPTASSDVPVALIDLPSELLSKITLLLARDDYHMLTLPLVCSVFNRTSQLPEVASARLASRVRQVVAAVVPAKLIVDGSNEWALAHVSGALDASECFLCPSGRGTPVDRRTLSVRVSKTRG